MNGFTSQEALYIDKDGGVTKDKAMGVSKLVSAGGSVPEERARELGLVSDEGEFRVPEASEPEAVDAPEGAEPSTAEDRRAARTSRKGVAKKGSRK